MVRAAALLRPSPPGALKLRRLSGRRALLRAPIMSQACAPAASQTLNTTKAELSRTGVLQVKLAELPPSDTPRRLQLAYPDTSMLLALTTVPFNARLTANSGSGSSAVHMLMSSDAGDAFIVLLVESRDSTNSGWVTAVAQTA